MKQQYIALRKSSKVEHINNCLRESPVIIAGSLGTVIGLFP